MTSITLKTWNNCFSRFPFETITQKEMSKPRVANKMETATKGGGLEVSFTNKPKGDPSHIRKATRVQVATTMQHT
jgi:hypothetical protein